MSRLSGTFTTFTGYVEKRENIAFWKEKSNLIKSFWRKWKQKTLNVGRTSQRVIQIGRVLQIYTLDTCIMDKMEIPNALD